jgi:RNA recognition motif-containing protein
LIRGLPFKIQISEIIEFFDGYGKIAEENIFVEESAPGRRTGVGLIIFETEDFAQDAKSALNKQKIGEAQRWVDLFDVNDGPMK